jgi:hypothetical protein
MPVLLEYLPVNSDARYGAHMGEPETHWRKFVPSVANRSMLGVRALASPAYPQDWYRN